MHLMLVAQLFLRYCRVPHIKLKLNCNRNHGNMTSLINTTTGGRLAIGYRAHFPLSSHPKLIYLVSSLMRATCGPTTPEVSFSSLLTDVGVTERLYLTAVFAATLALKYRWLSWYLMAMLEPTVYVVVANMLPTQSFTHTRAIIQSRLVIIGNFLLSSHFIHQ